MGLGVHGAEKHEESPDDGRGERASADELSFFEAAHQAFRKTANLQGAVERVCSLAGEGATVVIAGRAMADLLLPAIEHLRATARPPAGLTICAWEGRSGVPVPPSPWRLDDYLGNGEIRSQSDGRVRAAFEIACGMLSLYDSQRRLALLWVRDPADIPGYVIAAPFRTIFQWWAADRGCQLVHAAAVGKGDDALLIAGPGRSGKSTTAMLCMLSGLSYAGDDYVLVDASPTPRVFSLYGSGKLERSSLADRFPALAEVGQPATGEEKVIVFVHRHWPGRILPSCQLRAILLPRVTGHPETQVRSVSAGESMRALFPSSVFSLPGARAQSVRLLAELTRKLPSFQLDLGTDLAAVPAKVLSVLNGATA